MPDRPNIASAERELADRTELPQFWSRSPSGTLSHSVPHEPVHHSRPRRNRARTRKPEGISRKTARFGKSLIPAVSVVAALGIALACGGDVEPPTGQAAGSSGSLEKMGASSTTTPEETTRALTTPAGSVQPSGPTDTSAPTAPETPVVVTVARPATVNTPTDEPASSQDPDDAGTSNEKITEELLGRAEFYLDADRYERTVQVATEIMELNPNSARAYTLRGSAYSGLRQYDRALADINMAIELDSPNQSRAYLERATIHIRQGDYDQAIADVEQALGALAMEVENDVIEEEEAEQRSADAAHAMATAFFRSGSYPDYKNRFREALQRVGGGGNLRISLDTSHEEPHSKLQELNNRLILEPDYPSAYIQRAELYASVDWHERAVEDYTRSAELIGVGTPDTLWVLRARARSHLALDQNAEATRDLQDHERLVRGSGGERFDPEANPRVAYALAWDFVRAGAYDDARRVLNDDHFRNLDILDERSTVLSYAVLKGFLHALEGDFGAAAEYLNPPPGMNQAQMSALVSGYWLGGEGGAILARIADQTNRVEVDRYLTRLLFRNSVVRPDMYQLLLSAEMLIEQAPELPDGHIGKALVHLFKALLEIRGAEDTQTAQAMHDHYQMAAAAHERFRELAGPDDIAASRTPLARTYRLLAMEHLYQSAILSPDPEYRQIHFDLSNEASERYIGLVGSDTEFLAEYAFVKGRVFASWDRKEDAQKAYKEAFDLGYDRRQVEQALNALTGG